MTALSSHRQFTRRRSAAALVTAAACALLAACSASGASSSAQSGSSTPSASGNSGIAAAQALLAAHNNPRGVAVPMPTVSFKPGKKKMMLIGDYLASEFGSLQAHYAEEAIKALGWSQSPLYDDGGDYTKGVGYISQAIQQGYNAIDYVAMPTGAVTSNPTKNALSQGIPVGCAECLTTGTPGIVQASESNRLDGELIAAQAIVLGKGKGTFLTFTDTDYAKDVDINNYFAAYMKAHCPACKIVNYSLPNTQIAQPGPPVWTAALSRYPAGTVTAAITSFPLISIELAATEQKDGRSDIPIMDEGPSYAAAATQIQAGKTPYIASVAAPVEYEAWGVVDALARGANKVGGTVNLSDLPSVIVTKQNAGQLVNGASEPSVDYKAAFLKLWGK